MNPDTPQTLENIYQKRFQHTQEYRDRIWQVLARSFFQKYIRNDGAVLDLGCGYGNFINNITCGTKYGMDLNPASVKYLAPNVRFLQQDCSQRWDVPDQHLDTVFTSNFFEHLPSKALLSNTLDQAFRCLKPGGKLIAMGPNIKFLAGSYWDFWDHYTPLTELSLREVLIIQGFEVNECHAKFLPYRLNRGREYPDIFVEIYLKLPLAWEIFGKQFLVVASKPASPVGK